MLIWSALGAAQDLSSGGERVKAPGVETGALKKRNEINTDYLDRVLTFCSR